MEAFIALQFKIKELIFLNCIKLELEDNKSTEYRKDLVAQLY
jgi:hypothetical protein